MTQKRLIEWGSFPPFNNIAFDSANWLTTEANLKTVRDSPFDGVGNQLLLVDWVWLYDESYRFFGDSSLLNSNYAAKLHEIRAERGMAKG